MAEKSKSTVNTRSSDKRMPQPQAPRSGRNSDPAEKSEGSSASGSLSQLAAFEAAMKLFHARQLNEALVLFEQAAAGAERDKLTDAEKAEAERPLVARTAG